VAEGGEPGVVHRRSSRRWVAVGAIAVVLVLVIGYVVGGAAAASGPVSRADSALKATVNHNNDLAGMFQDDPFKNVDFASSNPDPAATKNALSIVNGFATRWQDMINGDRGALRKVQAELNWSLLTLPENSTIDSHRRRVDAGLSALATAQKALDLIRKQVAFLMPLMDAVAGFQAVGKAAEANDIGTMQSSLASTAVSMQKAITLANEASVPQPLSSALSAMQKTVTDMQALVAAVQSRNAAAINASLAAIEADGKALDAVDTTAIDKAENALIQPLSDTYNRDMKIASGG
jgi:cytochrome c556